jgi:hypothetical protein
LLNVHSRRLEAKLFSSQKNKEGIELLAPPVLVLVNDEEARVQFGLVASVLVQSGGLWWGGV